MVKGFDFTFISLFLAVYSEELLDSSGKGRQTRPCTERSGGNDWTSPARKQEARNKDQRLLI